MPENDKQGVRSGHEGHRKRLRQRARATQLEGFQPHEVLDLLLTYAIPRQDVNPLAHALIDRFGSLSGVLDVLFMAVFSDWLGFNDKIIKLVSNVFVVIFNYVASKLVIFKKH